MDWTSVSVAEIATELKNIRRVLEEMNLASMFREGDSTKIAYICDGKACVECTNDECKHTTNIDHAKNFKCDDGKYIEVEKPKSVEEETSEFLQSCIDEIQGRLVKGKTEEENNATEK